MNPFQLPRVFQLFLAQRIAHKNIRIGKLFRQPVVVRKVHDSHFRPAFSERLRDNRLGPPPRKWMPDANHQLRFFRFCALHGMMRFPVLFPGVPLTQTLPLRSNSDSRYAESNEGSQRLEENSAATVFLTHDVEILRRTLSVRS